MALSHSSLSAQATPTGPVAPGDWDGDGIADNLDFDNDNDGIPDDLEKYCEQNADLKSSATAKNKGQFVFFNWGTSTLANDLTSTVTFKGVKYTATISNVGGPGTYIGYKLKDITWNGVVSNLLSKHYYEEGKNEAFYQASNVFNTGAKTYTVTITAVKADNTVLPYPIEVAVFDPEGTAGTERLSYTTNGSNFKQIELLGNGTNATTGAGTTTVTYINDESNNTYPIFSTTGQSVALTVTMTPQNSKQGSTFAVRALCDTNGDAIPNYLSVDSDGDGCPDALEGSEVVRIDQIHPLNLSPSDPNYAYRGQIKVTYNGITTNIPANIISTSAASNGIPQLVNPAGSNYHATTNSGNLAGVADNTDGSTDVGQDIGTSQNASAKNVDCSRCFKPATTTGTAQPAQHGITALGRAGEDNGNWPMKLNGAYTVLDAKTKGFVINRLTTTQINALTAVKGMAAYDTTEQCLKIYNGTAWQCYNTQTCDTP